MRSHFSLLAVLVFSLFSASAQTYQGLLWKITGNGLEKPSFLYGTMHVSNKVAFHLSDSFYKAIEAVDVVSLEINPETWMSTMTSQDYVADKMGNAFSVRSQDQSSGFYKSHFAVEEPSNKELGNALSAELGILNSLLYRTSNYSADFQEDTYLDLFIYQAGRKQGKEITGLENLGTTMLLNEQAAKPEKDKEQKKILREIAERKQYELRKLLAGKNYGEVMEDAYRNGDLDLLDSMSRLGGTDKNHDLIIVYRNQKMAEAMDSIMQEKSLFAGIGAAHLPNSYGVIHLLREMGYTVRPVSTKKSDYSLETKDRIDKLFVKHDFSKQTSFDGSFSTMLPGRLYEFPESGGVRMAAHPDMANGARYVIARINTYASLYGKLKSNYMRKLDSLFFENIPGKILLKNEIQIDGFPGFDITNRTKKGDLQRYKIIVTPVEIIIFKASGKKDFIKREEVNQFFEEISFYTKEKEIKYSPRNNAYKISLSGIDIYEGENTSFSRGYWEKTVQSFENDAYYSIRNKSHIDIEYMEEDSFELNHITKFYAEQFDYKLQKIEHDTILGYSGVKAIATHPSRQKLWIWAIIKGSQYYLLTAQTDDSSKAASFFNSLQFNEFQFYRPFSWRYDTARLFSVYSNVRPPGEKESYYFYDEYDDNEDLSHQEETKAAVYYNKESDETVYVRYYKYHKYFYQEHLDSLLEGYKDEILQNTFFVRKENKEVKGNLVTYELEVGDTNTNRNILAKHFLKGGLLYSLYTETDMKQPRSKFINQFYSSFTPWDTTIGTTILGNKVDVFLTDLISKDSIAREAADRSFETISFDDEDAPKLIFTYQQSNKFIDAQEDRVALLEAISKLSHPEITPFLLKEYNRVGDSVQFQLPILKALAAQHTKRSLDQYCRLLLHDPPLTSISRDIKNLFEPLYDSLDLAARLYPSLLKLAVLPEYKEPVYELLTELSDSGSIKPRKYRRYWKNIAWEAQNEVKRHKATESDQTTDFYKIESRRSLYSYNDLLKYYAKLLQPYRNKSTANEFFQKAGKINSALFIIDLAIIKLQGGESVAQDYWNSLAENKNDRIILYQRLKRINRLDLFPNVYTYDSLSMSLYAQKARVNQYRDSLIFVHKEWISTSQDTGYLYFFKLKPKDETDWEYGQLGLIDTTKKEIERYSYEFDDDLDFSKYEDQRTQIELAIRKFEMKDRKRYNVLDESEFESLRSARPSYRYNQF